MCSSGIKISSKRLNCLNNQKWAKKVQSKHWQFRAEKLYEYVGNNPLSTQFLLIPHRKFSMVAVPFRPLPSPLLLYYRHFADWNVHLSTATTAKIYLPTFPISFLFPLSHISEGIFLFTTSIQLSTFVVSPVALHTPRSFGSISFAIPMWTNSQKMSREKNDEQIRRK